SLATAQCFHDNLSIISPHTFAAAVLSGDRSMPLTLDQFARQLEESGILTADAWQEFVPPRGKAVDGEGLARELVRHKRLTKYQAEEIYRGKGKSLVLGNYVILDKLGQGGMGMVLKAEHRRMKRVVALKVLSPAITKSAELVLRFQREVEAA